MNKNDVNLALRLYVLFVQCELSEVTFKDVLFDAIKARKDDLLTQKEFDLIVENKQTVADGYNEFVIMSNESVHEDYVAFMNNLGINV